MILIYAIRLFAMDMRHIIFKIFALNARILCALLLCAAFSLPAFAQTARIARSYIPAFPEGDQYKLLVLGDSLGQGIGVGLEQAFEEDGRIAVRREVKYGAVFTRPGRRSWLKVVDNVLAQEKIHMAVIMSGPYERQSIYYKGRRLTIGSPEWRQIVSTQIDKLTKYLKKKNIAVYWVGLPVMRSPNIQDTMQLLNDIYRQRAFINGVKYIDTWNGFVDQFSRYTAYGPDITGKVKRLRTDDGIHFTGRGNRKLAHFVEKEILRDLIAAKAERNIPLAGSQAEQAQISRRLKGRKDRAKKRTAARKTATWGKTSLFPFKAKTTKPGAKKKKADEVIMIEGIRIVRPALPDAAIASLLARAKRSTQNLSYETVSSETEEGLTSLGSISRAQDLGLQTARQRVPLTRSPYYRALIKGEKLKAQPGRVDDFSWPGMPKPQS